MRDDPNAGAKYAYSLIVFGWTSAGRSERERLCIESKLMSLTSKETRLLSRRLGRKCRILGSGVSQLFFANPGCEPRDSRNPVLRSFKFKSGMC